MDSIESLEFELTSISNTGVRDLAKCQNLKRLMLYGGRPNVGNSGLAKLEGHEKLESLELINTHVTDVGMVSLTKMPNLRSLVLHWDAHREKRLTDAALAHLNTLNQLETLELTGGWASEMAVNELRASLANCTIETSEGRAR